MSAVMQAPASKGLVLVVEDEPTSRHILRQLLICEGYEVLAAADGGSAVALFAERQPALAFIDLLLPDMDGYEVARQIRRHAGERYVPLVFLSAVDEVDALVHCVEAGGDDFLHKPCRREVLRAKLSALERTRHLYERAERQHAELTLLHDRMRREQEIAEQVFNTAVMSDNAATSILRALLKSTDTFNGDIMLSAHTPDGGLCVLLGDFTGHGLAAAIGALPLSQTFRAMCSKGFGLHEMLVEINGKLRSLLPTGMFMACSVIHIESDLARATVWNSGMPDILVREARSGQIRHRLPSQHPPLAVLPAFMHGCTPQQIALELGDEIILCSDGVTEARDAQGHQFGEARLEQAVLRAATGQVFESVVVDLADHVGLARQDDDISLIVVPCLPALFERRHAREVPAAPILPTGNWRWSLRLDGPRLAQVAPVPLAITQLAAMGIPLAQRQQLYVVLAELYSNALEHGVLGLDSALKHTPEGFADYYLRREQKLAALQEGFLCISLDYRYEDGHGLLGIEIADSGGGFDPGVLPTEQPATGRGLPSGHGVPVVRGLCRSLEYLDGGRRVRAECLI